MRFLAVMTPTEGTDAKQMLPLLAAEEVVAWRLYREGFAREFYLTEQAGTAVVIVEAPSADQVLARFESLPLREANLIQIQILELRPFLNWEQLFSPKIKTELSAVD